MNGKLKKYFEGAGLHINVAVYEIVRLSKQIKRRSQI